MRRPLLLAAIAAALSGCVSVEGLPDPRGALKPAQRLVVAVYPSPGPWIVGATDSKAEAAAKISPLGFFVQTAEDEHTLSVSKNLQQYLPRPRLGQMVQDALLAALRAGRPAGTVQTAQEAGIVPLQLAEWNKSKDQLDWRQRYYAPDPDQPAPRDYAKMLNLDDALILDVNVSFGTEPTDDGRLQPTLTAASRVYRGDTSRLLWQHEDAVTDATSSNTMTDIQVQPPLLTDGLQKIAPGLGTAVAASFFKAFNPLVSTTSVHIAPPASSPAGGGHGLVDMSVFDHLSSTGAPAGVAPSTSTVPAPPPSVSSSTPAVSVPIPAVPVPAPAVSVSTPAVSISTSP